MKTLLRIVTTLALLAIASFCLFGFLASFEALPPFRQWFGRVGYSLAGLICAWAIIHLWRPGHIAAKKPGNVT